MIIKTDITLKNNSEIQELLKDGGKMNKKEKKDLIIKEFKKGNIKVLGCGAYAVPSEFFLYGITPKYVREVLK